MSYHAVMRKSFKEWGGVICEGVLPEVTGQVDRQDILEVRVGAIESLFLCLTDLRLG